MNSTETTRVNSDKNRPHRSISIEICQGPDCVGSGGGAAILEIEELVKEFQYQQCQDEESDGLDNICSKPSSMCAVVGGCRDLCTVGPNIRVLQLLVDKGHSSRMNQSSVLESFHHVNDVTSCRNVVERAASFVEENQEEEVGHGVKYDDPSSRKPIHLHQSMMMRRADRIRWEALKCVSRTIAKCKKSAESACEDSDVIPADISSKIQRSNELCREKLSSAHRAALSASRGVSIDEAREMRRAERLVTIMESGLHKSLQLFDDGSESDDNDE